MLDAAGELQCDDVIDTVAPQLLAIRQKRFLMRMIRGAVIRDLCGCHGRTLGRVHRPILASRLRPTGDRQCQQLLPALGRGSRQQFAIGIIGGGGLAEANRRLIGLVVFDDMVQQPRGVAESDDQHAGGHRVEGAGVPHLFICNAPRAAATMS